MSKRKLDSFEFSDKLNGGNTNFFVFWFKYKFYWMKFFKDGSKKLKDSKTLTFFCFDNKRVTIDEEVLITNSKFLKDMQQLSNKYFKYFKC